MALSDAAFEMAKEVYATKKHPEATESELWQLFGLVNVKVRNMVFVVDGFDECSTEEQDLGKRAYLPARKRFLKSLEEAIGRTGARVLFVSREDSDIRTHVTRSFQNGDLASISWLEHEIAPPDSEYGIHVYAEKVVEERLHTKSIELKKDIARRLTQKSEGMFLYIYRIQARLKSSMSASKLRTMIDDAPRGRDFNEAYERDLQVIASLEDDDKRTGGRHTSVGLFRRETHHSTRAGESIDCVRRRRQYNGPMFSHWRPAGWVGSKLRRGANNGPLRIAYWPSR